MPPYAIAIIMLSVCEQCPGGPGGWATSYSFSFNFLMWQEMFVDTDWKGHAAVVFKSKANARAFTTN